IHHRTESLPRLVAGRAPLGTSARGYSRHPGRCTEASRGSFQTEICSGRDAGTPGDRSSRTADESAGPNVVRGDFSGFESVSVRGEGQDSPRQAEADALHGGLARAEFSIGGTMKITQEVVKDLLPAYFSGEASADTNSLVE